MFSEAKALSQAFRYLKIRPRSFHEMRQYLEGKGLASEAADGVMERLRGKGLIDDQRFAMEWAENRALGGKYGPLRVRAELQKKHVDVVLIKAALDVFYPASSQRQKVSDLWKQSGPAASKDPGRLARKLVGRGFDSELVAEVAGMTL